jgi:WD40 repeat protein/serine/threonine protein kinase
MTLDDRLVDLLMQAEDQRQQGLTPTAEELCRDCPELLSSLRRLLRGTDAVEQLLHASSSGSTAPVGEVSSAETPRLRGYTIHGELGRGGMAVVYDAEQQALGRRVALKVLPALSGKNPERLARFQREVRAAARLHHTNIVPVFEVGQDEGVWFYSMQYIPGQPLSDILRDMRNRRPRKEISSSRTVADSSTPTVHGPSQLSPDADPHGYFREVARMGQQVAEALACAHVHGVLHRDIKPANLLRDDSGRVWVADFGLAKLADEDLTQSGAILGTLRYTAPEQIRGAPDARSDIYSLGLTLYELLVLQPAFDAADHLQLLEQIASQEPRPPRSLDPRVPRDLETIVLKAIDKEPARRYATAADFAEDLRRWLADEPIRARPIGHLERLVRWCRRRPGLAALSGVLLLVTAVGFAGVSWQWRQAVAARGVAENETEKALNLADELGAKNETLQRQIYRGHITAASAALRLNNTQSAIAALDAAPAKYRNWEWQHFFSQLDTARQVLRGHADPVEAVAVHADGRRIASASASGAICLWATATGRRIAEISGAARGGPSVVPRVFLEFTADGSRLVSRGRDGILHVWDAQTGNALRALGSTSEPIQGLALSHDGRRVAAIVKYRTLVVWDLATGEPVAALPIDTGPDFMPVAYSSDGKHLAYSRTDRTVHVADLTTGQEVTVLRGMTGYVRALAFSPDGSRLATGSEYPDDSVRLWNVATGEEVAELRGHKNLITCVLFSPDGSRLASGSTDHTVRLWDAVNGGPLATLSGHAGATVQLAFNPTGTRLVSASLDQTLRLWNGETGELITVLRGHVEDLSSVRFSADGKFLVSGSRDHTVRLWDVDLAELNGVLHGHTSFVYDVAFSPDGREVATVAWDGTARTWDATTGQQTSLLKHDLPILISLAYGRDGKQLAVVERDANRVHLWDLSANQRLQTWDIPEKQVHNNRHVAVSRQGDLLAVSGSGVVRLWHLPGGEPAGELRGHEGWTTDVAFRPDGRQLASGGQDQTVRLWDPRTREPLAVFGGLPGMPYRLAYSADGRLLAAAVGKTVHLLDVETHQEVAKLVHGSSAFGLSFHPDGSRLAVGCADTTIRLWDVATHEEVAELHGHEAYVHAVAFSPDGTRLASASGDFTVRIWDTLPVQTRNVPGNR